MKHVAELLRAIASLLWPLFVAWVFLAYKEEIRTLLRRVKKGKFFGQEIELEDSLNKLEQAAKDAQTSVAPAELFRLEHATKETEATSKEDGTAIGELRSQPLVEDDLEMADDQIAVILQEAARSPKAALLLLAAECEREVRELLLSTGWHRGQAIRSIRHGFGILQQLEILPPDVASSVRLFSDVRNQLIHGYNATDSDILRAIDSGIKVLRSLRAIPHTTNIVYYPCAELFSDARGEKRLDGVCGLILETRLPTGDRMIFPTTRNDYQRGQRLSWEWNSNKVYGAAWYKEPDSGEIKQAWLGSAEFVGRNLDEI